MEDMSRAQLNLTYDGAALREHQMAVRDLAPALLAMGALVERANELFNGDQVKVSVDVHASFKAGSFGIDFDLGQSILQRLLDLAGRHEVVEISTLLALLGLSVRDGVHGVIHIVRWLRRRGISRVEPIGDGQVRLWIDEDHIDTEERVLKLLQDYKIRKELEALIAAPLQREGIDDFATIDKPVKRVMAHVTKAESHYFVAPPAEDEQLEDTTYEANLQVLTVAFKDDNKWRFTDGGTSFFAPILDEGFLRRVALNQEQFAKDDIIRAKVRRVQRLSADGLKTEYEVLRILAHRNASPRVQLRIDFNGDDNGPPEG
jgi:hypothetical protein